MLDRLVVTYSARPMPGSFDDEEIMHPYEECKEILEQYQKDRVSELPIFKTFLGVLKSYF